MKKFNFSKGLVIGLLTLALVITGFATVKASADEEATEKVANVTFNVTYKEDLEDEGVAYTYVAEGLKAKEVVELATVLSEMTTGEEENAKTLEEDTVMEMNGTSVKAPVIAGGSLTYANNKFTVANTLADNVDVTVTFTVYKAISAIYYDAENDTVVVETPYAGQKVYYADVKKSAGADLKGDKLGYVTTKLVDGSNIATIKLNDKSAGVKLANNKAAYLYVAAKTPSAAKAKYAPNVIIDPTECKKAVITVDYTVAGYENVTAISRIEITTTAAPKTPVVYTMPVAPEAPEDPEDPENPTDEEAAAQEAYEAAVEEYEAAVEEFENILGRLQYSVDGTTWKAVDADNAHGGFEGKALAGFIKDGKKLFFRLLGTDPVEGFEALEEDDPETDVDETVAVEAKNATRTSKVIKVAVKKQAVAKAVKVDVNSTAIGIKNGYDFAIRSTKLGTGEIVGRNEWITILPTNKAGTAESEFIATADYAPVAKPVANPAMFTKTKIKALSLDDAIDAANELLEAEFSRSAKIYFYYRKSASTKAPAQEYSLLEIDAQAAAPTAKLTSGHVAIADPKKNVFELSFNGNGPFEYLIVGADDYAAITKAEDPDALDAVNSKWTKLGKITVGKSKSKYKLASSTGKATAHTLAAGDIILVRTAGDKASSKFASGYIALQVAADKVSLKLQGEEEAAERYVVDVYTAPQASEEEPEEAATWKFHATVVTAADLTIKCRIGEDGEFETLTKMIDVPVGKNVYVKVLNGETVVKSFPGPQTTEGLDINEDTGIITITSRSKGQTLTITLDD